jgi:F-type H+-transporting ATPase subunit gamma
VEDIERIKERLDNIGGIQPIISSLRTIAAGSWHGALRRLQGLREMAASLLEVLADVRPYVPAPLAAQCHFLPEPPLLNTSLVLVIASERGLCGSFNETVLKGAETIIAQQQLRASHVAVATLGARATAHFERAGASLARSFALPVTRLPSFQLVSEIGAELEQMLNAGEVDAIDVVYAPYTGGEALAPVAARWLPISTAELPPRIDHWPEPTIETDPTQLFERSARQWSAVRFYELVTESAASEHAARFRSMEAASANLANLIEELTQSYHAARQHAITMEMLDLVAGSGILRKPTR